MIVWVFNGMDFVKICIFEDENDYIEFYVLVIFNKGYILLIILIFGNFEGVSLRFELFEFRNFLFDLVNFFSVNDLFVRIVYVRDYGSFGVIWFWWILLGLKVEFGFFFVVFGGSLVFFFNLIYVFNFILGKGVELLGFF